jgi:hypothetical protein
VSMRSPLHITVFLLASIVAVGCPGGDDGVMDTEATGSDTGIDADPVFPADYDATYVEVRNCRGSGDHDLNNIRILADPAALGPYEGRTDPFPEGAVVLKEEYDFGDLTCEGPIKQWTVMQKLAEGSSDETLGWAWQRVDADRSVLDEDEPRCIACHTSCGMPPDGYDWTCALP